jgi:beta-lactamase class A
MCSAHSPALPSPSPCVSLDLPTRSSPPSRTCSDSYIPRLLPPEVRVANKPGSLDGVRVDAGIVYAAHRPFAITVMTTMDRDERAAEDAIGAVALAAFRFFDMVGRRSPYGRVMP